MRCVRCGTDNKLKDRTANGGRCTSCNHPFTFEPTAMGSVKLTDPLFAKALNDLSSGGSLFFTSKQFLYFLDQRLKGKQFGWGSSIFLYAFMGVWSTLFFGGFLSLLIGNSSFVVVLVAFHVLCILGLFINSNSPKVGARNRKRYATALLLLGILVLVVGGWYSATYRSTLGYTLSALIGFSSLSLGILQRLRIADIANSLLFDAGQIQDWLERWAIANAAIDKLLPAPTDVPPVLAGAADAAGVDATNYSFDRLVVCDRPALAQLLIANNFHFEYNCAVLCVSGYPQQIFNTTMTMLRRNPDLQVFAFHDCSPRGLGLVHELANSSEWFGGSSNHVRIVDIGLLPRQVLAQSRGIAVHNSLRAGQEARALGPQIRQGLSPQELAWLDKGNYVELESFTPQKLLMVLQKGINGAQQLDLESGGDLVFGDGGGDFYAIDNFG